MKPQVLNRSTCRSAFPPILWNITACAGLVFLAGLGNADVPPQAAASAQAAETDLPTVAEKSNFQATSTHAQVLDFCERLAKRSPLVRLSEMGRSTEGKKMPLLIIAEPPVGTPEEAIRSKKLIVYVQGDIHAGEVDGKEGMLMLARDIVLSNDRPLLKNLVLVFGPIFNPDGNDRMSKTNRPGQVGPAEGMGVRHNAQDLDLNRDFVKLESPEVRALVRFFNEWDPAIFIDTHTTNGSFHRYLITYDGPRNAAIFPKLVTTVRDAMLPDTGQRLEKLDGFKSFFYGDFSDDHKRWVTYPALPRYNIQYYGLRNRIGILSESYSYASYRARVLASRDYVRACLEYASAHDSALHQLTKEASDWTLQAGKEPGSTNEVAIRQKTVPLDGMRTALGYIEEKKNGRIVATSTPKDYPVEFIGRCVPTLKVARPYAYLYPASLTKVTENLQRHGIQVEQLREDIDLDLEAYKITKVTRSRVPFQRHQLVSAEAERHKQSHRMPAGTLLVRTAQPLGTLAIYLLEPQTEDGLITWNFFDEVMAEGKDFPVLRLLSRVPITTGKIQPLGEEHSQKKPVSFDAVYGSAHPVNFGGTPIAEITWLEDGRHFLQVKDRQLCKVDALTGRSQPFQDPEKIAKGLSALPGFPKAAAQESAKQTSLTMNPQRTGALFEHENDLYFASMDGSHAMRLTKSPRAQELATFSPDGKFVAFVRDHNLCTVDVATQTEHTLTTDGGGAISNGKSDWVYFEEVFGRQWQAYWWSPDSKRLAFLRFDDQPVPRFTVLNQIPARQVVEQTPYPKPGEPNPRVRLGVVAVKGGAVRWVDLDDYPPASTLIVHVGWTPESDKLYFYVQDRAQTWLDVCEASRDGGKPSRLLRETTAAWVDNPGELHFLKDGSFLLASERTGWKHWYRLDKTGKLVNALTTGPWEARTVHRVDEVSGWVYLSGMKDSPLASNLYRVRLDGTGMERLTPTPGDHRVEVSPAGDLFVDWNSSFSNPTQVHLRRFDGTVARALDTNPVPELEEYRLGKSELVHIKTPDGATLDGSLTFPPDFDPQHRYPVWFMTYGGPHTPTIQDRWNPAYAADQMLAQAGIIVFRCDPRSASGKGAVATWTAYRQLGVQELKDIESAIRWLMQKPYVDSSRIGMSGHSYGGFMTAYVLTHSQLFAAGIAGAPVTDWRDYDSVYTERYMNTPQENPRGYEETSVIKAAKNLHGRLLIIHGLMDDNVHLQNTAQLIDELQKADKPFEIMVYPEARHPIHGKHYRRLVYEFIVRSLQVGKAL